MTLALKLLLAPLLVVASSLAGRRWGPRMVGLLVALPVVAGPILLITELEHGRQFGAQAASAALRGLITLAIFAVVFAWVARRYGWIASLAVGWLVCLLADLALAALSVPPAIGLILTLAATAIATRLMPAVPRSAGEAPTGPTEWPAWDLPARAVATALLVLTLTGAAASLGPSLTGVLAPFPIATSVVAGFTRAQHGPAPTITLLRGVLRGLIGFAAFCFLVATLLTEVGAPLAFSIAIAGTLSVQFGLRTATSKQNTMDDVATARLPAADRPG